MAAINGTLYAVFSGATPGAMAVTERLFYCEGATLNVDVDLPDCTTKESAGWARHLNGVRNWSIDYNGKYDVGAPATEVTPTEILASIIARNADTTMAFIPAIMGVATPGWSGLGTFKNIKIDAPQEAPMTFSGSIAGNAPLALFAA
jgi:predicted secreted protein